MPGARSLRDAKRLYASDIPGELHLRSLSTGSVHPSASLPYLSGVEHSSRQEVRELRIRGDVVGWFVMYPPYTEDRSSTQLWHWKSGQMVWVSMRHTPRSVADVHASSICAMHGRIHSPCRSISLTTDTLWWRTTSVSLYSLSTWGRQRHTYLLPTAGSALSCCRRGLKESAPKLFWLIRRPTHR